MAQATKTTGAESVRWDLTDLFKSPTDPAIESTLAEALKRAQAFEERYKGKVVSLPPKEFAAMMRELEDDEELAAKPDVYAYLLHSQNTGDPAAGRLLARVREVPAHGRGGPEIPTPPAFRARGEGAHGLQPGRQRGLEPIVRGALRPDQRRPRLAADAARRGAGPAARGGPQGAPGGQRGHHNGARRRCQDPRLHLQRHPRREGHRRSAAPFPNMDLVAEPRQRDLRRGGAGACRGGHRTVRRVHPLLPS